MAFGFVLVGGLSSRMGRDKSRLVYRGRAMAQHQAEKLAFVCGRAALVGKSRESLADLPFPFVEDGSEPNAAVYGLIAALSYSSETTTLVLAVDLPRISESFLAGLLDIAEAIPAPAIVPVSSGRPQPLCAVWRRTALGRLVSRANAGQLSLKGALGDLGAVLIPEQEVAAMPGGEPENFFNVNTPEDYASLADETHPYASRR